MHDMAIKPDNIQFLSTLPNYINFGDVSGNITFSGSIANGVSQTYSVTLTTSRDNTRFDVYGVNQNTLKKALFSNNADPLIYQFVSSEATELIIAYAPTSMTITIEVTNNTGALINLIPQVIAVTIVQYKIPY